MADWYLTPIWEVMEGNYRYNLKLSDFAAIAQRSLSKFKRDFYDHYQTTPSKWLIKRRLEHAKLQLETTKLTVSENAYDCGFLNPSHFSRTFKENYHVTPSVFRQSFQ